MKRVLVPLVLVLATAAPVARAQGMPVAAAPADSSWSLVVTPAVVSQYMFRGVRRGGLSFQPSIEGDYGNLAIGVWASTPLRDKVPGVADPEIDPYLTYTVNLTNALNVQPTLYVYSYVRAPLAQGAYHATFEPNLALNYTWHGVKLTPKVCYDVVLKGATYELTAATAVPLTGLGTELDFTATAGTFLQQDAINQTAPKVKDWGDYWLLGVAAPIAINRSSKLTVGFAYTAGSGNYAKQGAAPRVKNTAAVGRGVFSLSYTWTF